MSQGMERVLVAPIPVAGLPPREQRPGRSTPDADPAERRLRIIAMAACVCVHVGLAVWWSSALQTARPEARPSESVTRIAWVKRTPPIPSPPPSVITPVPGKAGDAPAPRGPAPERASAAKALTAAAPLPQAHAPASLDLSVPAEGVALRFGTGKALERPRELALEPTVGMTLQFQDNSLGGRLQRMRTASICADLRRSIGEGRRRGDGSGVDIASRQLRELGCR